MKIDLERVAQLARLKIGPEKREMFETQMQAIVAMVENLPQMQEDYAGVDPAQPMPLREDAVPPSLRREAVLANAPQTQAGCAERIRAFAHAARGSAARQNSSARCWGGWIRWRIGYAPI